MHKFIALSVAVTCWVVATLFAEATVTGRQPSRNSVVSSAQANETIPATGSRTGATARCRERLTVNLSTSVDVNDAGRVVIGEWRQRAESLYGAEFANFKLAEAPVVRCRRQGNETILNCFAEGRPCSQ